MNRRGIDGRRSRGRPVGLTVLVNAGPWLSVPPPTYGGIENVVATLVPQLRGLGHRVVLATVGESTLPVDEQVSAFDCGQFQHITGPYNQMMGIAHAHMTAVVTRLRQDDIDVVHDHLEVVGPGVLAGRGDSAPPVLQTLHWDMAKHPDFYRRFDGAGRVYFAGVSESQLALAPPNVRGQALGAVPLATPIPAHPVTDPDDYFLTLGRVTPVKGYDLAVRACAQLGLPLVLAGPVAGLQDWAALRTVIADPANPVREYVDVRYFREQIEPHLRDPVRWVGSVGGAAKERLLARSRAVLFPLRWEEPGGTAVVEALAAGVPVVATRRGVLPELVDHGVTGWLADTEAEFVDYLSRVDELDRRACREAAVARFSPAAMALRYETLYRQVIGLAQGGGRPRRWSSRAGPVARSDVLVDLQG